jgi:hypothetical protein
VWRGRGVKSHKRKCPRARGYIVFASNPSPRDFWSVDSTFPFWNPKNSLRGVGKVTVFLRNKNVMTHSTSEKVAGTAQGKK